MDNLWWTSHRWNKRYIMEKDIYMTQSSDMDADTKIWSIQLGEWSISALTSGIVIGGNKLKSGLSNGSKVDGSALHMDLCKEIYRNLKSGGRAIQYGDYDVDRLTINSG